MRSKEVRGFRIRQRFEESEARSKINHRTPESHDTRNQLPMPLGFASFADKNLPARQSALLPRRAGKLNHAHGGAAQRGQPLHLLAPELD